MEQGVIPQPPMLKPGLCVRMCEGELWFPGKGLGRGEEPGGLEYLLWRSRGTARDEHDVFGLQQQPQGGAL